MGPDPRVQAKLQALQDRFDDRLKGDASAILRALDAASEARARDERLREVRDIAHRLAGAAGSFGRPEAGALARRLEAEVERLAERPEPGLGAVRALAEALERLSRGDGGAMR